jgi:cytochrome d ubiquinol oxidase subunit I
MSHALRTGVFMGALLIPVQILVGDLHGLNTLEHQPAKVAAMEGNWETRGNVPLLLFAMPNEETRSNDFEIGIPGGASLILKHEFAGVVPGLNDFVAEDGTVEHPPVAAVFWAFRIMVGTGMAMLLLSWVGAWYLWRRGEMPKLLAYAFVPMAFSGWIATVAGWYVTEIGRQPWLVSGVLSTRDALGPVAGGMVLSTFVMYMLTYVLLLSAYLFVIFRLTVKATKSETEKPRPGAAGGTALPAPGPNAVPAE